MLEVRQLVKTFGALRATDGIDLEVREGETHAVIGPNGAGKTTFISQLAGNLLPDAGSVRFAGEDVTRLPAHRRARKGLARSFQITSVFPDFTALHNVALAV
jgi:branched-chain amino acid transport system ATP-binding protein